MPVISCLARSGYEHHRRGPGPAGHCPRRDQGPRRQARRRQELAAPRRARRAERAAGGGAAVLVGGFFFCSRVPGIFFFLIRDSINTKALLTFYLYIESRLLSNHLLFKEKPVRYRDHFLLIHRNTIFFI